jgi:hypothetical protein
MHMFAPPPAPGVQVCILVQSVFAAQLVLHPAAVSHAKGAQSTRVPCWHMPLAQVDGGRNRSWPSHMLAPHTAPSAVGAQVPCLPGTAHDLQFPHDPEPQQNPSVQKPLRHSEPTPHAWPFGLRFVHE